MLNPQVRRAVGRVREQAFFRLFFYFTPRSLPLPQARRPDSCQTVCGPPREDGGNLTSVLHRRANITAATRHLVEPTRRRRRSWSSAS